MMNVWTNVRKPQLGIDTQKGLWWSKQSSSSSEVNFKKWYLQMTTCSKQYAYQRKINSLVFNFHTLFSEQPLHRSVGRMHYCQWMPELPAIYGMLVGQKICVIYMYMYMYVENAFYRFGAGVYFIFLLKIWSRYCTCTCHGTPRTVPSKVGPP